MRQRLLGSLLEVRGHEPPPGPRRHRDLRDRQGLRRQRRRRRHPRVVAARIRADRPGRDPGLEPPGPAVRPRRRQGHHRAVGTLAGPAAPGVHAADRRSDAPSGPGRPGRGRRRAGRSGRRTPSEPDRRARAAGRSGHRRRTGRRRPVRWPADRAARPDAVAPPGRRARSRGRRRRSTARRATSRPPSARHAGPLLVSVELFDIYRGRPLPDDRRSLAFRLVFAGDRPDAHGGRSRRAPWPPSVPVSPPTWTVTSAPDRTGPPHDHRPVATGRKRAATLARPRAARPGRLMSFQGGTVDFGEFLGGFTTVDLLLVLYFMGFFVLGLRPGHDPPTDRYRVGPVLVPVRRERCRSRWATSSATTGRSSRGSTPT